LTLVVLILGPCRDLVTIGYRTLWMKSPKTYKEVANQLALCCQSEDSIQTDVHRGRKLTATQYPTVIRELNPSWVQVSPEWANVEMGGGFYHYGYRFKLDNENSTDAQSHWNLFYYTEKGQKKLFTLVLDKLDAATPSESP
jgi:hypothetical protein